MAFRLSAGRTVSFVSSLRVVSAELSVFLKLSVASEEFFVILKVYCVASYTICTGRDSTAFSTATRISSIVVEHGVTA